MHLNRLPPCGSLSTFSFYLLNTQYLGGEVKPYVTISSYQQHLRPSGSNWFLAGAHLEEVKPLNAEDLPLWSSRAFQSASAACAVVLVFNAVVVMEPCPDSAVCLEAASGKEKGPDLLWELRGAALTDVSLGVLFLPCERRPFEKRPHSQASRLPSQLW
ncbi:hypothetical protein CB1_064113030 [Camelus ferus]|nr:hypothetical protein CB1_064113030 [Camelus ferus]